MSNVVRITPTVGAVSLESTTQLALDVLRRLEELAAEDGCDELTTAAYRAAWEIETIRRMLGWPNH